MLKIRPEQMDAFQPVADNQLVHRVGQHLRERHPQVSVRLPQGPTLIGRLSDASLYELVKNGVARARSHGLTWESSIAGFIVLMFKAAPNFDQHSAVKERLTESSTLPDNRVKEIVKKTSSSVWIEIKETYDPASWQLIPKGTR